MSITYERWRSTEPCAPARPEGTARTVLPVLQGWDRRHCRAHLAVEMMAPNRSRRG